MRLGRIGWDVVWIDLLKYEPTLTRWGRADLALRFSPCYPSASPPLADIAHRSIGPSLGLGLAFHIVSLQSVSVRDTSTLLSISRISENWSALHDTSSHTTPCRRVQLQSARKVGACCMLYPSSQIRTHRIVGTLCVKRRSATGDEGNVSACMQTTQ